MTEWGDETEVNEEPQNVWLSGVFADEVPGHGRPELQHRDEPPIPRASPPGPDLSTGVGYVRRLRDSLSESERASEYLAPYNYHHWGTGHDIRVRVTVALGSWLALDLPRNGRVVDLSAGDGTIPLGIVETITPLPEFVIGDLVMPDGWSGIVGPIEETILTLDPADRDRTLFVLSETAEHLEDPFAVLASIRERAARLLLSTPIGEGRFGPAGTPQHLWGWDQVAMGEILRTAGWTSLCRVDTNAGTFVGGYDYQIWACA